MTKIAATAIPRPTTASASIAIAAALLGFAPAEAGVMRASVSGHGTDASGCGATTSPCRTLQYAHDNIVSAGGEIDILDPAGYGPVTITKAISIINDGAGTASIQQSTSGVDAVTITAGAADNVTLSGLTIDGLGAARDGVGLNSAGKLTLVNCLIRHFAHDGVYLKSSGTLNLEVVNVISADNANNGFDISPEGTAGLVGDIEHSYAMNNASNGIVAWGASTTGTLSLTVANSDVSDNGANGILSQGQASGSDTVVVREVVAEGDGYGYVVGSASLVKFSRSEAMHDLYSGIDILGGEGMSYGDNDITGVLGGVLTSIPQI